MIVCNFIKFSIVLFSIFIFVGYGFLTPKFVTVRDLVRDDYGDRIAANFGCPKWKYSPTYLDSRNEDAEVEVTAYGCGNRRTYRCVVYDNFLWPGGECRCLALSI